MDKAKLTPFTGELDKPAATSQTLTPFDGTLDGEEPKRGLTGWARDIGATAVKGAIGVPEMLVGLADIPTGGRVGKFLENEGGAVGFRPKQAKEIVNDWHSDATKEAQRKFQEADGFLDKAAAAVQNPSLIATAVGESIPSMLAGGALGRGALATARGLGFAATPSATAAGAALAAKQATIAGAAGEGLSMAGSAAEQIRQETEDGLLTPMQSGAALLTGVAGGVISRVSGGLQNRLGIGDADTMAVQGLGKAASPGAASVVNPLVQQAAARSIPNQVVLGAINEGLLEELPQSLAEQMLQNVALGKPWHQDLDAAAIMGTLSGGVMGAGAAGFGAWRNSGAPEPVDPGSLSPKNAADYGNIIDSGIKPELQQQYRELLATAQDESLHPRARADAAQALHSTFAPEALPKKPATEALRAEYEARLADLQAQEQGEAPVRQSVPPDGRAVIEARRNAEMAAGRANLGPDDEIYQSTGATDPVRQMVKQAADAGGALSSAAVVAIDTGAAGQMQQAADQAQAQAVAQDQAKAKAGKKADPAAKVDASTGEIAGGAMASWSDDQLSSAFRGAQDRKVRIQIANELQRRRTEREQADLQAELQAEQAALDLPDAPDSAFASVSEDAGDFTADPVFDGMATTPTATKGRTNGPQAAQAQQAGTQPAQPADSQAAGPTVSRSAGQGEAIGQPVRQPGALTNAAPTSNNGAQAAPAPGTQAQAGGKTAAPAGAAVEALRTQLREVEDKILRAAPGAMAAGGGDIEAAMKSRKVPVTLKARRKKLQEQLRAAPAAGGMSNDATKFRRDVLEMITRDDGAEVTAEGEAILKQIPRELQAAALEYHSIQKGMEQAREVLDDDQLSDAERDASARLQKLAPKIQELHAAIDALPGKAGSIAKFGPETGTLGIPRSEMPQVPAQSHGGLVKHLNAQGIAHETTTVDAAQLKPTQAEYIPEKVEAAKSAQGDRAVIVSKDGHIIDGHHQAMAAAEDGKTVKAIVLDAPVDQALEAVKNSPSASQPATKETAAQPAPKKPSRSVLAKLKEQARAEHFAPGNVIASYGGGHDRVVSYQPSDEQGNWSVTVRAVKKQGDTWVDVPNERERTHSTQPDAKELTRGPVGKVAAPAPSEIDHNGTRIYQTKIRLADTEPRLMWAVESATNKAKRMAGERTVSGDTLHDSLDQAKAAADREAQRDAAESAYKAELEAQDKARQAAEEARKAENRGKSVVERHKDAVLSKQIRDSERGDVVTRREWVERKVEQGLEPKITQEDKIKPMSRLQFNRASNAEQAAHERKIKQAGKKDVFWLGDFEVTKIEHDYAQSLKANASVATESEQPASGAWSETVNNYTNRPVHRYVPDPRIHWATVQNPSNGVFVIDYRIGDAVVSSEELTGGIVSVKGHVAEKVRELDAKQASHQDPGEKPEAATKAVVSESLKTAARNEDATPSEMRKWLLAEIEKEMLAAPDRADYDETVKRVGEKDAISMYTGGGMLGKNTETGFITFDVPGDGKFKVRNSMRGLLEFRKNVNASGGFKDSGQKPVRPPENKGALDGGSKMDAITNMIEEGDFEAARDYAEAVGIKLDDVKVPKGDRKPQWDAFRKNGTLPPEPFSPSKEWKFLDLGGSFVNESEAKQAVLTRVADGVEYVATVKGRIDNTSAKYTITKDGKQDSAMTSRSSFGDALRLAEAAMPAANDKAAAGAKTASAEEAPKLDLMGFTRTPMGNGIFQLRDGNLMVEVQPTLAGLQAVHRSAKSSPRLTEQQAVEWAANIRSEAGADSAPAGPVPKGRTYLMVPFEEKDLAKVRGAKWDAENKAWYSDPISGGMADGEINGNLVRFIPEDRTADDRFNYYGDKGVANVVALNAQLRDGVPRKLVKRKHPDEQTMFWSVVPDDQKAGPSIPEGYKPAGEPFYREGKQVQGYAPFNVGDRVTVKDSGGQSGVIDSLASPDESGVFASAVVKFDNGSSQMVPFSSLKAPFDRAATYKSVIDELNARAASFGLEKIQDETRSKLASITLGRNFGESMEDYLARNPFVEAKHSAYKEWLASGGLSAIQSATANRRDPAKVSAFTPYQDGDIVSIGGQDWTIRQDMPGWYLTNTGDWKGKHPTIRDIKAMNDLIAQVEQAATAQPETQAEQENESPKLTTAEAKALMEWQDMGQRAGVKTHALHFYENQADKAASRGRMTLVNVTKGDKSASNWFVDGDDKPFAVLGMAKKRAEELGMLRAISDGFVEGPFAKYEAEDAADVFPMQEAASSYSGISHSGTQRAKSDAAEFEAYIERANAAGLALAETDEQKAAVEQATKDLRADYLAAYRRMMSVRAGTYSGFVAGRSGLNSKQADQRNSAYDRAIDAFVSWQKENDNRVRRAALDARTDEAKQADIDAARAAADQKAQAKEDADLTLMRKILNWKKGGEPVAIGKAANLNGVNLDKAGYPSSVKLSPPDGSTLSDDKFDLAALFRRKGMSVPDSKRRVRELVDAVRAEDGAQVAAAKAEPAAKTEDSKTPTVDRHMEVMKGVREGTATPEQFKASFNAVVDGKQAILAELDTKTKVELLRTGGAWLQMRYASEKKSEVAEAFYRQLVGEYTLGEGVNYGMGKGAYEAAVRRMVEATDEAKLKSYLEERKAAVAEALARRAARVAAITNPQTLADFREVIGAKISDGMSQQEAFLTLTPEQRIKYDTLAAESTRERREELKRKAKTQVATAGNTSASEVIATKHTKLGHDLFVVKLADRVERDEYLTLNNSAKRLGGSYSSFRGNGAIPGFQFRNREAAEAFRNLVDGDTTQAQELAAQRRDAFEDDRSQTAVERLRAMAEKLEAQAEEEENRERKANTAKRARYASSALAGAAADKAKAKTMRNIADAIEAGNAKFLDEVRTKTQVDMLTAIVATAKSNELRAKYPSYADQEKRRGEPPTAETADFAEFPSYASFRSDLATLARQMLEVEGTKKLGQRLMSVADDVTDTYLEFAKKNISKVSQFGRGDAMADFANKDDAERAIRRSGLTGKAIVLAVKRGQNRVILSPGEAIGRKIWEGDGDKRITLNGEFGAELVEAIGRRGNKQNSLTVPWQFQNAYDRRKALSRLGIETASEYRSAVREFIALKEQAVVNRTKELELQMVGRKADGLDFFPTPAEVADQMIEAADLSPDMAVLEPSAGMGHLADRIREAGAEPDVIEASEERRELLLEKGYHMQGYTNFLAMEPRKFFTYGDLFRAPDGKEGTMRGVGRMGSQRVRLEDENGNRLGLYDRDELTGIGHRGTWSGYDRIIMNPPFSNRRDAEHVMHAYTLLKPGGRIVAIMGEGVFFGQDKKAQEFRDWLESVGGTSEKLPAGSFMDPSLPVNTSVNARMVVIDKPAGDLVLPSRDDAATNAFRTTRAPGSTQAQLSLESVEKSVQAALRRVVDAPAVQVVRRPEDIDLVNPFTSVPKGLTFPDGSIVVFSDGAESAVDVLRTVFHELFHRGSKVRFERNADYITKMLTIAAGDETVRAEVAAWKRSEDGQDKLAEYREKGPMTGERLANYEALAVEEALATMAERIGTTEPGLVKRVARFLARVADAWGMTQLGHWMRNQTTSETERFVMETIAMSGGKVNPFSTALLFNTSQSTDTKELADLFKALEAPRGLKLTQAYRAVDQHPLSAKIREVESNFLDILERLDDSGLVQINC